MVALGINPQAFLDTQDDLQKAFWIEVTNRVFKLRETQNHNLAVAIANQVGRLFKTK